MKTVWVTYHVSSTVSMTLSLTFRLRKIIFGWIGVLIVLLTVAQCEKSYPIKIDGRFDDWQTVPGFSDPDDLADGSILQDGIPDVHDPEPGTRCAQPKHVYNDDANLLEFKFTHDASYLYAMLRAKGDIERTQQQSDNATSAGRNYIQIMLDVDNSLDTGYCSNLGGYYPSVCGIDFHFEIQMYNGTFNMARILLHAMHDNASYVKARAENMRGVVSLAGNSTYTPYTEWIYYDKFHPIGSDEKNRCPDGPHFFGDSEAVCFVENKANGPFKGAMAYGFSSDRHSAEISVPFGAFLKYANGEPVVNIGNKINVVMALKVSGEYSTPIGSWATDGSWPIKGYVLTDPQELAVTDWALGLGLAGTCVGSAGIATLISCLIMRNRHRPSYQAYQ